MRQQWWVVAACLGVACGGDDPTVPDGTGDDDDDTAPVECNLPPYDHMTMSCGDLATAWNNTVEAGNGCTVPSDCAVLRTPCEQWWQVPCFHAVNASCVTAGVLEKFTDAVATKSCEYGGDSCDCSGETPVDCVDGECVIQQVY